MIEIQIDKSSSFKIQFEDSEIDITVRFLQTVQIWIIDITFNEKSFIGQKLSCMAFVLRNKNTPFDFVVKNNKSNGIDPHSENDFNDGSYSLFMLDREDMTNLRGYEVE